MSTLVFLFFLKNCSVTDNVAGISKTIVAEETGNIFVCVYWPRHNYRTSDRLRRWYAVEFSLFSFPFTPIWQNGSRAVSVVGVGTGPGDTCRRILEVLSPAVAKLLNSKRRATGSAVPRVYQSGLSHPKDNK